MNGIHQLRPNEVEQFIRLSEFAFQYELTEEQRAKRVAALKPEELWGYYSEGKLAAKLHLMPYSIWIGGKEVSMGGIASVSTWPEYRRSGYVGKLLANSFAVMRENGMLVSMLHPFSIPFYRKYGYEIYVDRKQYEVELAQFPRFAERSGHIERTEDLELLNSIYEQYAKTYNGMLKRSEDRWKSRISEMKRIKAVWYNEGGEPRGYICFNVKDNEMHVDEFVCLDEQTRRALWTFIDNHDSMIGKVHITAPADDELAYLMPNPRFKQELIPYFMARIVDAPAFIKQYSFEAIGKMTKIVLHLEDQQAEWNRGSFLLTVDENGVAQIEPYEGLSLPLLQAKETDPSVGISCDIKALTAILFGYQKPRLLHKAGVLKGTTEEIRAFSQLLPEMATCLFDYF
ncbi:MAG: GNAT family N-acetyltransferase [Gorillibacterium sp.]|nr:GNAT family N-acetyltransferase [Gorillibacterium sp.]